MASGRYQIRVVRYDKNWKEETVVLYTGAIKQQMEDLLRGLKTQKQSDKVLSMHIADTETGEITNEHRFSY